MRALRITALASQDLEDISDYFLKKSIDAGDRFVESFSQKCQNIARFPFIGKSYSHIRAELRGVTLMTCRACLMTKAVVAHWLKIINFCFGVKYGVKIDFLFLTDAVAITLYDFQKPRVTDL